MKHVSADQRKVILGIINQMQIDEEIALQEDGKFTNIRMFVRSCRLYTYPIPIDKKHAIPVDSTHIPHLCIKSHRIPLQTK